MTAPDPAAMRAAYDRTGSLDPASVPEDPIVLFGAWFDAAAEAEIEEPNAMTLATVSPSGHPSSRIVLLKGFDDRGFVFYTNYESRKGRELEHGAVAALGFWWPPLARQVRIEGSVQRASEGESDAYFASRPRGSQLGAWASPQSAPLDPDRPLAERLRDAEARFEGGPVPRPSHWGGYRVHPVRIEFWQGRPDRMHDRVLYERTAGGDWRRTRLAP